MTSDHDPETVARLQAQFARFAAHAVQGDPLYAALSAAASRHAPWAALLAAAPSAQQSPTLWLAALQDRVLALAASGERPPLAGYFASVGEARAPDAALEGHLGDFIALHRDTLAATIATRSTQTNEIGRCAVLWPALRLLAAATGGRPMALLDVGSSAGLNLGVDHWRYRWLDDATGATLATTPPGRDPRAPEIACRLRADAAALVCADAPEPVIAQREGIDRQPVAVDDAAAVRWLRACLWPHDAERRVRFDAAVAIARARPWRVRATADAAAAIDAWRDGLPADVTPVVFNSWVLAYFEPALLREHVERLLDAVARRGVAWISAEDPTLARGWWPGRPASVADALPNATAWTLARADGRGGVAWTAIGTSHAHGHWLHREGSIPAAGR